MYPLLLIPSALCRRLGLRRRGARRCSRPSNRTARCLLRSGQSLQRSVVESHGRGMVCMASGPTSAGRLFPPSPAAVRGSVVAVLVDAVAPASELLDASCDPVNPYQRQRLQFPCPGVSCVAVGFTSAGFSSSPASWPSAGALPEPVDPAVPLPFTTTGSIPA